jgi:hypothetical protein
MENSKENAPLVNPVVKGRMELKWITNKSVVLIWWRETGGRP